ncbi:MlaD family protein [Rivibacter subsaxonicus]|uniref:Paraquat-inducible protein B n=1 Tax=Rivibacter subsaxonicus TaxID=457575 RepID=A0A4Q7V7J2_9BURK|nr:MlaD family protein [Rivibacter subsaxonicus]RZT91430.1 paraquat-inducible protein B [Rivibacter subsaxonicus]
MKRNALLVGAFVIVSLLLVVAAVLWLSGSNLFHRQVPARLYFADSVSGLYIGAPVSFRGVAVGQVDRIDIEVDGRSLEARIPVMIRLQPEAIRFSHQPAEPLSIPILVERGLRARLVAQSFVTGQRAIDLDFVPGSTATLVGGDPSIEIPTLADRFGALVDQVAELPLRQTVQELRNTLQVLQRTLDRTQSALDISARELGSTAAEARKTLVVAAQALREVQGRADTTLDSVTRLSDAARETVVMTQPELQKTLASARAAAETAQLAMARVADLTAPGSATRDDLDAAVRDLSQAARGLREWSELLEEKPNAVIFGNRTP